MTDEPKQEVPLEDPIQLEIENLKKESAENYQKYLRTLAEVENTRKRLQKEKEEATRYALENVLCEFLGPIDYFQNALKFTTELPPEVKNWMVGFEMILGQFKEVLYQNNVRPIECLGRSFDPHFHEAVELVETNETAPGIVLEELMKGYLMGDRVIRPAKVKVAKAIKIEEPLKQEE